MSGRSVNKLTADIDNFMESRKSQTISILRYTGNDLAKRDMRKFTEIIYKNFEQIANNPKLQHNREEITRLLTSSKSIILIATNNNVVISYLIAEITQIPDLSNVMHIYYVYTSPTYRSKGVATKMLNLIQNYTEEIGINILSLTFDTYDKMLERFYLNNNFVYDKNLRSYLRYDMLVKNI